VLPAAAEGEKIAIKCPCPRCKRRTQDQKRSLPIGFNGRNTDEQDNLKKKKRRRRGKDGLHKRERKGRKREEEQAKGDQDLGKIRAHRGKEEKTNKFRLQRDRRKTRGLGKKAQRFKIINRQFLGVPKSPQAQVASSGKMGGGKAEICSESPRLNGKKGWRKRDGGGKIKKGAQLLPPPTGKKGREK